MLVKRRVVQVAVLIVCTIFSFQVKIVHAEDNAATSKATISFYGTIEDDDGKNLNVPNSNDGSHYDSKLPSTGSSESKYGKYLGILIIFIIVFIVCLRERKKKL